MKLYMVRGYEYTGNEDEEVFINFYGVFSTEEKAEEIANELNEICQEYDEALQVEEIELDEPSDLYYFMKEEKTE